MVELNTKKCLNNNVHYDVRTDLYYIVENNVRKNVLRNVRSNVRCNDAYNVLQDLRNHTKLK